MSKLLIALCAVFAVARAGNLLPAVSYEAPATFLNSAPTAYEYAAAAPLAIHAPAVGTSHQSTLRSLDGNSAISHYSKSVDSAFSSVRKVDTRITNDAKILAPTLAYAAAPYASPYAATYAAPATAHIVKAAPILSASEHYAYAAESPAAHVISHTAFTGLGTAYAF